ncbi:MAG: histidine kinase [Treponema sp.]|nr:histidine kinase [Treponema sp.]
MIILITVITVWVSSFLIRELTGSAINSLFSRQDIIIRSITRELDDGSRILSRLFMTYDIYEDRDYSQLFKHIKMQLPYSKLIFITLLNEDGSIMKSVSNMHLGINRDYVEEKRSKENKFIEFSSSIIISHGRAYHDSMNINSLVPLFIDYYENIKIRMYVFMEMDISSILYNARFSFSNIEDMENKNYTVSIYTEDMELIETSENYPLKKISTLTGNKDQNSFLSEEELRILKTRSNYHRTRNNLIELYNVTSMGYVVKSTYPYSIILSKVRYLNYLIVSFGLIVLVLIIIISSYSIHYRHIKEREILLQIETIQAKLNPHFLFNTLNSMVGLVFERNYKKLLCAFKALSVLLRSSIEIHKEGILLSEELEYIKNYIEIQRLRYEDTFDFFCEVKDESLLFVYIPHFSIQPIIENCFVHALAVNSGKDKKIYIKILIKRADQTMHIDIINNGPCDRESKMRLRDRITGNDITASEGHLGLALINKEIKLLYGQKFGLELLDIDRENIFSIRLKLPACNSQK